MTYDAKFYIFQVGLLLLRLFFEEILALKAILSIL